MRKYIYIALFSAVLGACVKDKPGKIVQPQVHLTPAKKVYIVNEGPFQNGGTGSVSLYDPESHEVIENFYELQNNTRIGNVAQSLNYINGKFYIVVNNANKILICDQQFKNTALISGLNSPRYILPVTNQKAYVSDLYENAVSIVDLNTNTKTGRIPCHGKTEKMVLLYNKAFITNTDQDYLYVVNTLTDAITDSVFVGRGAASLVVDRFDRIWVLGSGAGSDSPGRLSRVNPISHQVELFLSFGKNDLPGNICQNHSKDTLYFLNNGIYRMSVSETALPSAPLVAAVNRNFYGLGLNPNDHCIYAADAMDYTQRSQIYIYHPDGSPKRDFKAGIISNGFYFE